MIPFIIKKKLVNVPEYAKGGTEFEVYAICRGFQNYDLQGLNVGHDIAVLPEIGVNGLSLKIDIAWCLYGIINKIQPTIYQLRNDIWFNSEGEKVQNPIPDPGNEGEFISNPDAVITEVDYWLNLMVNIDVNDRYLIEQGFERLDIVNHYWENIEL